ncbi:hypothetical protein BDC45DRAFT_481069 [Circinella umbellata]|nr:hypothetical protein BDC45DRAFT_481069 [Circinella umbellata]
MLQNPSLNQGSNDSTDDNKAMSLLSTFMLQGWVMTDQACTVPGCPVPIMRSKDGSIRFCVKHDTLPTTSASGSAAKKPSNTTTTATVTTSSRPVIPQQTATTNTSSTPSPTLVEKQSTPAENDEYAERERRREQSSKASQLIGQKLLQRWTLLNETCPNSNCYGIPLMRDSSKQIVCVVCDRTYNDDLEPVNIQQMDNAKETEDEPTEYKDEPTDDEDRIENGTKHQKKRRKTDNESYVAAPLSTSKQQEEHEVSFPSVNNYTSPIANKMRSLLSQVEHASDPIELKHLFEAIEAGANAIKACSEASSAIHKIK